MNIAARIKDLAYEYGAEKCGIASIDRFSDAPEGFSPKDVYRDAKSIIVFLISMPSGVLESSNPVPYTKSAYILYSELDRIGLKLCRYIQSIGGNGVPVPSDNPYQYWDKELQRGQGIISHRHAAQKAGLGFIGKSNLLINPELGNMAYIGSVITDLELEADQVDKSRKCPPKCRICLDECPVSALDGDTVDQKLCRSVSFYKNERGFDIYDCYSCRKLCILREGIIVNS